jgi:hypothetical protein
MAEFAAMSERPETPENKPEPASRDAAETVAKIPAKEIGGRDGPEPVRYGDWEKNGRCIDF